MTAIDRQALAEKVAERLKQVIEKPKETDPALPIRVDTGNLSPQSYEGYIDG